MERKEKRKQRYWLLKNAGYSGADATKYKSLSDKKVKQLIDLKLKQKSEINHILRGGNHDTE